jgi:hypothetical protein
MGKDAAVTTIVFTEGSCIVQVRCVRAVACAALLSLLKPVVQLDLGVLDGTAALLVSCMTRIVLLRLVSSLPIKPELAVQVHDSVLLTIFM